MIHFEITIFADVMAMFRGEFKDEYIRQEIAQRLSEDDATRDEIVDAICDKYDSPGNESIVEKLVGLDYGEFVKFVTFDKNDSEINYDETAENSYAPDVVAIRLGCDFHDEKALRPGLFAA